MTPENFLELLSRDEYLVLDISPEEFGKLESLIRHRTYVSMEFLVTSY